MQARPLAEWTKPEIGRQCGTAFHCYREELKQHYTTYFAARPELKRTHRYCAWDIAEALPRAHPHLAELVNPKLWHRWHLSGGSSQVLAVALLGAAAKADPKCAWLWRLLGFTPAGASATCVQLEYPLPAATLEEDPRRPTSIDCLVSNTDALVCIEAKWWEEGIGACSCADKKRSNPGDPRCGDCRRPQESRRRYWKTARELFGLPPLTAGRYCPISTGYQAIRNVAAARALADGRNAAFVLIFDDNNPYFRPCGDWPGWPALLEATLPDRDNFRFRAISWQKLVPTLPLDADVQEWAHKKHRLPV